LTPERHKRILLRQIVIDQRMRLGAHVNLGTGLGISGGGLPMRADMPIAYQARVMRETLNRLTPDQQENLIEAISLALGLPVPPNPALHAVEPRAA
jgi:hypothetical protein